MQSSDVPDQVRDAARRLAPSAVLDIEELRKGANSRVFRVKTSGGAFALKKYPMADDRDRQGAEARALAFFQRAKINEVPQFVASDVNERISLMSWLDGVAVAGMSDEDVGQFAEFQLRLDRAIDEEARRHIGLASETCHSGARIVAQTSSRLDRLKAVRDTHPGFAAFFDNELLPAFAAFEKKARAVYAALGEEFDSELPQRRMTLIASDFGAHNALRLADGRLAFVDFEYFGWDDPVTSVANFVLHPSMQLTDAQRAIYVARLVSHFEANVRLRIDALLPLYAVRWCGIILSDFLPDRWRHRAEAQSGGDWDRVKTEQLNKARNLLGRFGGAGLGNG